MPSLASKILFVRVFVLCSGRTGSTSLIRACAHIENFTAGHETMVKNISSSKFDYPKQHIEADNRLSWFLGQLDKKYGDDAYYVVLKRNQEEIIKSFNNRWDFPGSIIRAFAESILMLKVKSLSKVDRLKVGKLYCETIYSNIDMFLKDKSNVIEINLESIKEDYKKFWDWIGAEGDLEKALSEFNISYNASKSARKWFWQK